MNILSSISVFIVTIAIILVANGLCKKYIYNTVRINKWIPLIIAIILFIIQFFIGNTNIYVTSGLSIFAVLFFLWFTEISQTGGPRKKDKKIVIKSKAKPNRVKKK